MGDSRYINEKVKRHKMWPSRLAVCAMSISSLSMFIPGASCQRVVHMQVKTADEPEAGMSLASVDVELQNEQGDTCIITQLNSDTLFDFSPGEYNTHEGETLEECLGFTGPHHILQPTVTHSGFDNWKPEWFRILFDDSVYVQCNDGYFINNFESHVIECK